MPDQDPVLTLASATSAINNTEFNKGFTSFQWAFGRQASVGEEELRRQLMSPLDRNEPDFAKLLNQRQLAEDCARKAKAAVVLSKLKNTSIRHPIRTYHIAQPVMLWRKFLKTTLYKGRKGGKKHVMRPRWVGPGRVVLHEWVPGQGEGDRVQIAWVVIGSNLYRASVHSIRPLSEREQLLWKRKGTTAGSGKNSRTCYLVVPTPMSLVMSQNKKRPWSPSCRSSPTRRPTCLRSASTPRTSSTALAFLVIYDHLLSFHLTNLETNPNKEMLNDYEDKKTSDDDEFTGNEDPSWKKQKTTGSRRSSTTSKTPLLDPGPVDGETKEGETRPGDTLEEPDAKRPRTESDKDDLLLDLNRAIQEIDCGYVMEFDLNFTSNRQRKMFMRNPQAYLVKKVSGAEVCYRKLNAEDRKLFDNAKASEVSSFIRSEAVRRCLSVSEQNKAKDSQRILKARWVLVWKPVPEESRQEALEAAQKENTTYSPDGSRKAKARIVVLGFMHPDLLDPSFNSTAPVQSQLMRNLSLCMVAQRGWQLEGLDMQTAFLQTGKTEEAREIWTYGVPELKQALGAEEHEVLRILKNVYGNSTAPSRTLGRC